VTTQREPVKRRTADERREDVIRAAIIEFATFGLHGGSTERIAERAGISQPYVLRLFGTKKALFLAALNRVTEEIVAAWKTSIVDLEQRLGERGTPEERLLAMGMSYEGIARDIVRLRLILQGFASSEDEDVRAMTQGWLGRMFAWVRRTSDASPEQVRIFFAQGMMLAVAASVRAADRAESDEWARAMLMMPIER
jgi:AcrR family transcriptional regulator